MTIAALDFVFNTRGEYWFSCEHFIPSVFVSNSYNLQLTAEASIISSISIIVIFIWIGVRSISFRVSLLFDKTSHSGTYGGIKRCFQGVAGSYSRDLLMSTWSASQFLRCRSLGSLNSHHSSRFSYSTLCKQLAACSISGGLTKGSSRQGTIARYKALWNRLVISGSPRPSLCVSSPNVFAVKT